MKFVLILYIFAIFLVCNAGPLRRIVRSEPDESENVEINSESTKADEVATESSKNFKIKNFEQKLKLLF